MEPVAQSWMIGAAAACDIRAESPYVSGRHCRLERDATGWVLEDLGSKNGTFVNGVRLEGKARVTPADTITLGRSFAMPWPAVAEPAPSVAASAAAPAKASGHSPPTGLKSVGLPAVGKTILIGRGKDCDVVLDFPMVSSRHASIEHVDGGWIVRDLGSTNGTFVGGHRITEAVEVRAGDVIGLGSYRLTLATDGRRLFEQDRRGTTAIEAVHVSVDAAGRRLVGDVSLVVRPGELVGIMGPSGAGKSTLLAALVGSQEPAEGRVLIGGTDLYSRFDELRGQVGFVPQDDIMHADLTVGEALWYSARLRLPRDFSDEEIRERIATVVSQLGLAGTEQTRIGTADRRGISGGQRKRVNVAMELITDPPMLVLDEPTSGLSSTDALSLVRLLRRLANEGKTVVLTIHQPSVEILKILSGVAVIARDESTNDIGTLVWYGPAYPDAARFFEPAAGSSPDAEAILRGLDSRPVADWRDTYRRSPAHEEWIAARRSGRDSSNTVEEALPVSLLDAAFQAKTLMQRMLAVKFADRWNTGILLAQAPLIALLVAGVFGGRMRGDVDLASWPGVSSAVGMTAFLLGLAAVWFGCSNAAREIVAERAIYRRERMVGLSAIAYLGSKIAVLGILCLLQCLVLLVIVGLGCGLEGSWWYTLAVLFLAALAGMAMGLALSVFSKTPEAAAAALPLVVLPLVILGGSLLPLDELPSPATFLADMMPSRWAFEGLVVNEAIARHECEVPDLERPEEFRLVDMAETWFPIDGWRSGRATPVIMLAALSTLGVYAAYGILTANEGRRGQRLIAQAARIRA
jgi:ABC-type multidrug transport system ATPase subunit/pSer/pThr/pTyr-binding forkhead associated (FHA) protein/ABC-type multidrug transport system permease subunit